MSKKINIIKEKNIKKLYKYWQIRIFYSIFIGYIFFYLTRKSLIFSNPLIIDEINISINDIGIINTLFYLTYGISKLISGFISDRFNSRYLMSLGLIFTGICNIIISFTCNIKTILIFWIINAIFQAWGWPPITKQINYWYKKNTRGIIWSFCSISHNIGGAISPIIISYLSIEFGWRKTLIIIGLICIIFGFILLNRLRDKPETIGLPPIEKFKNKKNLIIEKKNNIKKIIVILSLMYFFIYAIKTSINDWTILYLINQKGYNLLSAGFSIFYFEIGGIIGMITAGWITDKIFNGERIIFIIICIKLLIIFYIILLNVPIGYKFLDNILISILGFLIFAPQMLVGLLSSEIVEKKNACKSNSMVGFIAYIGAATAGYPFGLVINFSWNIYFIIVLTCIIILILINFFIFKLIYE